MSFFRFVSDIRCIVDSLVISSWAQWLPVRPYSDRTDVPIYISRDFWRKPPTPFSPTHNLTSCIEDPISPEILPSGRKGLTQARFSEAAAQAASCYRDAYGPNFHAVYPFTKSGCVHSKVMVLEYPEYLRVVITSANLCVSGDLDIYGGW
jgi:hypothetical protein